MTTSGERPQPYIGVSGVVSPDMEAQLEAMAINAGIHDAGRLLALGVKAVHKTQFLDIENKYGPEWYPVGEESFRLALRGGEANPDTLTMAQIYLDVDHVADPAYRTTFMKRIVQRGQPWLEALQFDMLPWHIDTEMLDFLHKTKEAYGHAVLLQCHKEAMEDLGPRGVVQRLGNYADAIDYVLFDASHGTGHRLEAASLDSFLEEAYESQALESTGMAIAGGLDETAVREDLPELVGKYPGLSWDAEGRLHPLNEIGKRPLDMDVVKSYLGASAAVLAVDYTK